MAKLYDVNPKDVTVKEFADFIVALEAEIPNLMTMLLKGKFGVTEKVHIKEVKEVKTCENCKEYARYCGGSLNAMGCEDWKSK